MQALGWLPDATYWVSFDVGDVRYGGGATWLPERGSFSFRFYPNEGDAGGYWLAFQQFKSNHSYSYNAGRATAKELTPKHPVVAKRRRYAPR